MKEGLKLVALVVIGSAAVAGLNTALGYSTPFVEMWQSVMIITVAALVVASAIGACWYGAKSLFGIGKKS